MDEVKIEVIDFKDQENECLNCGHISTSFGELYDKKRNKITSWNKEDNVVCPKCRSFDYYII